MSSTLSPTDYDSLEIQQQYNDINNRWEVADEDWDNENSSARLFERSRPCCTLNSGTFVEGDNLELDGEID
ncbi:hypothetical protein E2320_013813 [Naja naja]|nr:hypothetical protein E2320_013813 [Naja naja]